jgi:hypothetical protein
MVGDLFVEEVVVVGQVQSAFGERSFFYK